MHDDELLHQMRQAERRRERTNNDCCGRCQQRRNKRKVTMIHEQAPKQEGGMYTRTVSRDDGKCNVFVNTMVTI